LILISNVRYFTIFFLLFIRKFKSLGDKTKTDFCEITITPEFYDAFTYAIKNHYWYQMFIDDLPIWGLFFPKILFLNIPVFLQGIVGEMDESGKSAYIWTHKKIEVAYNDDRIVDVNLTSESKVRLQTNMQLPFSYEVTWKPTNIPFSKRFDKYLDPGFFQHKVKNQKKTFYSFIYFNI
jgi:transmembrane 9 superfamily protein 3